MLQNLQEIEERKYVYCEQCTMLLCWALHRRIEAKQAIEQSLQLRDEATAMAEQLMTQLEGCQYPPLLATTLYPQQVSKAMEVISDVLQKLKKKDPDSKQVSSLH